MLVPSEHQHLSLTLGLSLLPCILIDYLKYIHLPSQSKLLKVTEQRTENSLEEKVLEDGHICISSKCCLVA